MSNTWARRRARAKARLSRALKRVQRQLTVGVNLHLGSYHLYWDPVTGRDLRWVYVTNDAEEVIHRMLMTLAEVHRVSRRGVLKLHGQSLIVTGVAAVVPDPDDPVKTEGLPSAVIRVAMPRVPDVYQAGTFASWDDFFTAVDQATGSGGGGGGGGQLW